MGLDVDRAVRPGAGCLDVRISRGATSSACLSMESRVPTPERNPRAVVLLRPCAFHCASRLMYVFGVAAASKRVKVALSLSKGQAWVCAWATDRTTSVPLQKTPKTG